MKKNPRHALFCKTLSKHGSDWPKPWEGYSSRFQGIEYPTQKQILGGEGAFLHGGRLNVRNSFPVVYGSTDEETALAESKAHAKRYGLTIRKPRILVTISFKLQWILDLRDSSIRRALGATLKQLGEEDWEKLQTSGIESLGQTLGRAVFDSGAEAIIIPSFASKRGVNIAFFPTNKIPKSVVTICDGEKLPKAPKPIASK